MIYYKVKAVAMGPAVREFDEPEAAIRAAMSYDHENVVLMADSQDPLGQDVQFAYVWLNTVFLETMASGDFIDAAERVTRNHPFYKLGEAA